MISYEKIFIKGVFGNKLQEIFYFSGSINICYFFIHGLYGSCSERKYFRLARKLNKLGYHVILFNRSRSPNYSVELSFDEKKNFFIGKTFKDEIEDTKIAFNYSINNIIKKGQLINLVGFSLGGTLSSYLIENYKNYLNTIFLFGSGISSKNKERPIVSSYPSAKEIIKNFSRFQKTIVLIQGSKDVVVDIKEAREIIFSKQNNFSIRILIILEGVDHQFKTIFDKKATKLLEDKIFNILISNYNY